MTPFEICASVGSWFGAIITIFCYLPQTIKTLYTKDTTSLSKWFFILGFTSSIGWIWGSSFSMIGNSFAQLDIAVMVANIIGLVCNLIILIIKFINLYLAHKTNVSEQVFCSLQSKHIKNNKFINKL